MKGRGISGLEGVERRDFLKIFSIGTVAAMSGQLAHRSVLLPENVPFEDMDTSIREIANSIELMSTRAPNSVDYLNAFRTNQLDLAGINQPILAKTSSPDLGQYIAKMIHFERSHGEDTYLGRDRYPVLISSFKRIDRVQNLVGHGNFNVVSFDEMLGYGRRYSSVGEFTQTEKTFLEELFTANAKRYGFLGKKVINDLTAPIPENDRKKVGRTGHFLYRGESERLYKKLQQDLGTSIVLTSGIRSVVKQTHLFLAKTIQSKGNLSKASRSLAPPGHSYHGVGDFDVGKVGFGRKNFTQAFAETDEFRKLVDLGYVDIRYPRDNMFGVRYEPWHIKVV
jgi:D-alanyl-D-alanine carboxypeptidase